MTAYKLNAGEAFPAIEVNLLNGERVTLGQTSGRQQWQAIFVYRGKHCPLCTSYLNQLEGHRQALKEIGVEIIAVSADSRQQLEQHTEALAVTYPIAFGLTQLQMESLGLYISRPRSAQETDHNFSEPALFVINEQGKIHVVDISNNPFIRPELDSLANGLRWIKNPDNNYPIRGTLSY